MSQHTNQAGLPDAGWTRGPVKPYKLGVVGAGQVGSAIAYASLIRRSARLIALYDINEKVADAQVEDLSHGTLFTDATVTGGGDIEAVADSQIVIVTAGANQKPGQTRLDLAEINANIMSDLMPKLLEVAPDAIYVIVTNPCDVLTVVAQQVTGLDNSRLFSTGTLLDTARLRYILAQYAGVAQQHVHASVVGEHGDSEFVLWSNASIAGVPLTEWQQDGECVFTDTVLREIEENVTNAAYRVIEGKGATNYAIGLAASYLVESILSNQRSVLPVSSTLKDYYGVSGVALSVPSVLGIDGVEYPIQVPMNDEELDRFHASADALRETLSKIGY